MSLAASRSGRLPVLLLLLALALAASVVGGPAAGAAGGHHGGGTPGTCAGPGTKVAAPIDGGSVTVSQTTDLVNQVVHVCWEGFRPSGDAQLLDSTTFPVRVYQCRTNPVGPQDCYGSSLFGSPPGSLPDGPSNHLDAVTAADGTGSADLEVRTKLESSTLGCSSTRACSLVVVRNYGTGDSSLDFIYATRLKMDETWAWAQHVTVPLTFAATGADCPIRDADVTTSGAAMVGRAMARWQPATCIATQATNVDYTPLGEPQARQAFLAGQSDVGLTMLPLPTDPPPNRPLTYAPLTADAIVVAFRFDDAVTGQPITGVRLNARLIAKLVTESYGLNGYVAPGSSSPGNPATLGNPISLFADPEFVALNAGLTGVAWPTSFSQPLLLSDSSDMTYELTRWLADDPATRAFLAGTPDEHGMHVNTTFTAIQYPVASFESRDPFPPFTYGFAPVLGLDNVARNLVRNQPPGAKPEEVQGVHAKNDPEQAGSRDLVAIVDSGNAAAFGLQTALLPNASGAWVTADATGLAAGVSSMTADEAGLLHANHTTNNAAAYPLVTVQYAMAPTSGLTADKAEKVARLLDFAAGPGQVVGSGSGHLPPGYLPLPAGLAAATRTAAAAVRAQAGGPPPTSASPTPAPSTPAPTDPPQPINVTSPAALGSGVGGSRTTSAEIARDAAIASAAAAGLTPPASTAPVGSPRPVSPAAASRPIGQHVGPAQWALLAVLAVGLVAAVAGPGALLAASRPQALTSLLARVRRVARRR